MKKYFICLALILSLTLGHNLSAREQLAAGQEGKMLSYLCKGKASERQSMRDLIDILSNRINVKRVQLTPGNCYLTSGKTDGRRYLGLFDPIEFDEIFYIIK